MRDDFAKQTIIEIAKGVGYRCSNPGCSRPTVSANAAQNDTITIGVAAHICAASPGGPRYNLSQTKEVRRSKENGIWLCQNCGRLVDVDSQKFTVDILTEWKRTAQERAFRELVAPAMLEPSKEAERVGLTIAADNTSVSDASFDALFKKIHTAASLDLAAYKRARIWSEDPVELTLRLYNDQDGPSFSVSKLPLVVEVAPAVTIVAPPGMGKTTAVLQIAAHVLAANSIVPLYFRLGDWSAGLPTLLSSLQQRSAFRELTEVDFLALAQRGRLLLLLDGWNELAPASQKKLRIEVDQIRREYPDVRIIATTRRQMLDVPITGPRISIELLSEDQEMAIARVRAGTAGEKIVYDAWRTTGVRELITIPLYLSALLSDDSQSSPPTTKEELLRLFVEQHERVNAHAESLQDTLLGCHAAILTALAIHLNGAGSTTMTEATARQVVMTKLAELQRHGQIAGTPEPAVILEVLTSHHTLMRSEVGNGSIAFQHQQFQEWYASHRVSELIQMSAAGDSNARAQLRADIFDRPSWEESILFAVEGMSRRDGGAAVVAHAIGLALPIDPMLAADMIYRATASAWEIVKAYITSFVERWHSPGSVDRAVRFMIITGRPEFESLVWPLASSTNSQIQLPTLRIAPRFRPSVLGNDIQSKISVLPEKTRERLLKLIASESGLDGMDLATELAIVDPSPIVQAEVFNSLRFRRAERHMKKLLAQANEKMLALVAARDSIDDIRDPELAKRLEVERAETLDRSITPLDRLRLLLRQPTDHPDRDANITAAIADANFPIKDPYGGSPLRYAQQQAPAAVLQGLRLRLEAGLPLPFHVDDFLQQLPVIDEGAITTKILDVSQDNRDADAVVVVAGLRTVGMLVNNFLMCDRALGQTPNDRRLGEEYRRLRSRIAATRTVPFVESIIVHSATDDSDVIAALSTLVHLHGGEDRRKLLISVDLIVKQKLIEIFRGWTEAVILSPKATRHDLNEVSNAIGRFGFCELVPEIKRLLEEDLARLQRARDGFMNARRLGDIRAISEASMRYGNQYQKALSNIGGEEAALLAISYLENRVFGFDAALVLKTISDKRLDLPEPDFRRRWPWFEEVAAARVARGATSQKNPENTFAAAIFEAVDRLAKAEADKEGQVLAIRLARVALAMPHSNEDALIERVVGLPQPLSTKRELFAAMVLDGQILNADLIMRAIDEWLEHASKNEAWAWHEKQNTWEIEPWLELLPFTNRPNSVLDALVKVKAFYGPGHPQKWERVLSAVAALPGADGENLLAILARTHKDIADDLTWMHTIFGRESTSAVHLYIDLLIEGAFGHGVGSADVWHIGQKLAECVQKFPSLKGELRSRYETVDSGKACAIFENFFGELADSDDLVAMIKKYAAIGRAYDSCMSRAVRAVTLRHEQVQEASNAYYVYPASVSRIRKFLFDALRNTPNEAALAKKCLVAVDVLRDEHGIAENDTRHPDLTSEVSWPVEATGVFPDGVPN